MTDETPPVRGSANWAASSLLDTSGAPAEAINLNVTGRRVTSPLQGFGQLWQKTYRASLPGAEVTPAELIAIWKAEFGSFWPSRNRFFGPLAGIAPGETALLNLGMPGGVTLSTGVFVLYADEESFTLMTPQGHMFAGWVTFSAARRADVVVAEVSVLMRASDPLYEVGLMLGGHRMEDRSWEDTLQSLATRVGSGDPVLETTLRCVERRRQWRRAGNVWQNAGIRTVLYSLTHRRRRA